MRVVEAQAMMSVARPLLCSPSSPPLTHPSQTKSGKYPYLYSQSQAIHGRSMIPCQDTPAIKATYSSRVTSTLPVLMSGLRKSPPPEAPLELGKKIEYVYDQVGARHVTCTI